MTRTQRLSLFAAMMRTFVVALDAIDPSSASRIAGDRGGLRGGLAGQQWVVNGYLLALAALILVGGSLGDVFGERRVFSAGVLGFGASSLLCARAEHRGARRGARPAGRLRRAAHAQRAGGDRRGVRARQARRRRSAR